MSVVATVRPIFTWPVSIVSTRKRYWHVGGIHLTIFSSNRTRMIRKSKNATTNSQSLEQSFEKLVLGRGRRLRVTAQMGVKCSLGSGTYPAWNHFTMVAPFSHMVNFGAHGELLAGLTFDDCALPKRFIPFAAHNLAISLCNSSLSETSSISTT